MESTWCLTCGQRLFRHFSERTGQPYPWWGDGGKEDCPARPIPPGTAHRVHIPDQDLIHDQDDSLHDQQEAIQSILKEF